MSLLDTEGNRRPDGNYTYELRTLTAEDSVVVSGMVEIREGNFVDRAARRLPEEVTTEGDGPRPIFEADQVISDDLVVQGGACIGTECVDGDPGGDSLRIKGENPSLRFVDVFGQVTNEIGCFEPTRGTILNYRI